MLRCPKCASPEVRAIPAFEGDRRRLHGLPREAARPRKRRTLVWLAMAAVFAFFLLEGARNAGMSSVAFGIIMLVSAVGSTRSIAYNSRTLPGLLQAWERSKICTRCGAIVQDDNCQNPVALFGVGINHTELKEAPFRISQ